MTKINCEKFDSFNSTIPCWVPSNPIRTTKLGDCIEPRIMDFLMRTHFRSEEDKKNFVLWSASHGRSPVRLNWNGKISTQPLPTLAHQWVAPFLRNPNIFPKNFDAKTINAQWMKKKILSDVKIVSKT